jgi:hypothetical protein
VCVCVCVCEVGQRVGDERGGDIKVRPTLYQKVTDKVILTEIESIINLLEPEFGV